jgi:hypothetical protein
MQFCSFNLGQLTSAGLPVPNGFSTTDGPDFTEKELPSVEIRGQFLDWAPNGRPRGFLSFSCQLVMRFTAGYSGME